MNHEQLKQLNEAVEKALAALENQTSESNAVIVRKAATVILKYHAIMSGKRWEGADAE